MDDFQVSPSAAKSVNENTKSPEISSPTSSKPPFGPKASRNIILNTSQTPAKSPPSPYLYIPKPFFFYGSLTDPLRLQEVLQLPAPPVLKSARTGGMTAALNGMAYIVETEEHEKMLQHYETDVYRVQSTRITIEGEQVFGKTFVWANDPTELVEGTWSLEEWKKEVEEEIASHFRPVED